MRVEAEGARGRIQRRRGGLDIWGDSVAPAMISTRPLVLTPLFDAPGSSAPFPAQTLEGPVLKIGSSSQIGGGYPWGRGR